VTESDELLCLLPRLHAAETSAQSLAQQVDAATAELGRLRKLLSEIHRTTICMHARTLADVGLNGGR